MPIKHIRLKNLPPQNTLAKKDDDSSGLKTKKPEFDSSLPFLIEKKDL